MSPSIACLTSSGRSALTAATTGIIVRPSHSQRRWGRRYTQNRRSAAKVPMDGVSATRGLLVLVGLGVQAAVGEQSGVRAALDDPPAGEHEDLVGVLEHRSSVRD